MKNLPVYLRSPQFSYLLLRLGLGMVFLFFGIGKFRQDEWAVTMHEMAFFTYLPWSIDVSVAMSGIMEVATGLCLVVGIATRFFALLASAQLTAILVLLYFQGITEIRDVGLLAMALFLVLCPGVRTGQRQ